MVETAIKASGAEVMSFGRGPRF